MNDEFRTDNFDSLNVRGLTTPECPALTNMSHEGKIHIENLDAFN